MGKPPTAPRITKGAIGPGLGGEESNPGGIGGSASGQGGGPSREKFPKVSAATYGGPESKTVREFDKKTREEVGGVCLSYIRGVMIGSGTEANLSEIDRRFVALVKKMAGRTEDLNYNIVAKLQHSDLRLERLESSEWALLNDTLFILEKALGMTVGAEATPADEWLKKKNFVARLIARGKAIAEGRVIEARETGYSFVAALDEEAVSRQRSVDDWKKVSRYLKENFRDLPYQCIKEELDSAGLKGFVLGKDLKGRSLKEQTADLVKLMQARRRLYWHLTGGGGFRGSDKAVNDPNFDRYTIGIADVRQKLMTKLPSEYTQDELTKLEIEASLRATKEIATELCNEATVSWVKTGGPSPKALEEFNNALGKLGGGEAPEQKAEREKAQTTVNQAKSRYGEINTEQRKDRSRLKQKRKDLEMVETQLEDNRRLAEIFNLAIEQAPPNQRDRILRELAQTHARTLSDINEEKKDLTRRRESISSEIQTINDRVIGKDADEKEAKKVWEKAEAELAKLGVATTEKEEKFKLMGEALRKIVGTREERKEDGEVEIVEGRMHEILYNLAHGTIPLDQLRDDPDRWQDNLYSLRRWVGLEDSVFDEAMGPNSAYFQVFLTKALNIPGVDPKELLEALTTAAALNQNQIDLLKRARIGILESIRDKGYSGLEGLAYQAWDALRVSFVDGGIKNKMRIDYSTVLAVAEVVGPVKAKVAESPLSIALKRQDFYPGINTAVQYLTLADGTKLALVVKDGKNIVVDANGRRLGTSERVGTGGIIEGTTTPELKRLQEEIFVALSLGKIRGQIPPGADTYLYMAYDDGRSKKKIAADTGLTLDRVKRICRRFPTDRLPTDPEITIIVNAVTGATEDEVRAARDLVYVTLTRKGDTYFVGDKPYYQYFREEKAEHLSQLALDEIGNLEQKSNKLREQRKDVGEYAPRYELALPMYSKYQGEFYWLDPASKRKVIVKFTPSGIRLQLVKYVPFTRWTPQLQYSIADGRSFSIDADDAAITAANSGWTAGSADLVRAKAFQGSLLERGFYALTLEERPGRIPNTHIDLGGGKVYDFGIGENDRLVRWDQSGKEEMALEALNRDYRLGVLDEDNLKKIRQELGMTYLKRLHERWQEAWRL